MKLIYQLEPSDLVAFNEYHVAHSDLHKKQRRKHRIVVPIVYLVLSALLLIVDARIGSVLLAAFAIIWFLLSPRWLKRRYRKHFQKHVAETVGDSLKEPVTLELHDDGIHSASYLGQSTYKYSAVGQIVGNGIYTYVYIDKGMALVLPDDRISRDQIDTFVAEIKTRKESANHRIQSTGAPLREPPASDS